MTDRLPTKMALFNDEGASSTTEAHVLDVSPRGFGIELSFALATEEVVLIEGLFPGSRALRRCLCRVAYCRPIGDLFAAGLEHLDEDPTPESIIEFLTVRRIRKRMLD